MDESSSSSFCFCFDLHEWWGERRTVKINFGLYLNSFLGLLATWQQRDGIYGAGMQQLFTHFKTNTKSIDIYRIANMLCPLKAIKILWKIQNGLGQIKLTYIFLNKSWVVRSSYSIVAQLTEWLLLISEDPGSNPSRFFVLSSIFFFR